MMYLRLNISLHWSTLLPILLAVIKYSPEYRIIHVCEDNKGLNIIDLINWSNLLSHLLAKFSSSKKSNYFEVIQTLLNIFFSFYIKKPRMFARILF